MALLFDSEPQLITDHCNKLAVGGFAFGIVDGISEIGGQHIDIAAVPRHLDGVADCPFNPG